MAAASSPSQSVLEAPPPRFSADEAAAIAADRFGLRGTAAELGSERDQTFLIDDGGDGGVLKISNLGEDGAVLDLETRGILHASAADPELPLPQPRPALDGVYHTTVEGPDGLHFVRLLERMRGRLGGPELDDDAVRAFAQVHARLGLALRGFFHPAARRDLLWDLGQAGGLRPLLGSIDDPARRRIVERVLDRYDGRVVPVWPRLRAQVVHGDFNLGNVLLDERDRVAGIVDFGDTAHTALVADFAIGVASLLRGRPDEDVFRVARIAVDGYASRVPLEQGELDVLGDLVAARLATIVAISAWRVERYPENAEYIQEWDDDSWQLLELFDGIGHDAVARELGAARPPVPTRELARRRRLVLGPALTELTYREPVHVVRGEGVWLFDAEGRRLLDAYNNVPVVGHCHPRVTEAVARQTRALNTHSRYLYEPLMELAERLTATMPAGSGLDTVMLVNSGSEANELAWRLATACTGHRGAIVTDFAYHGVTAAIAELSPEEWPDGEAPANVRTIPAPGPGAATDEEMSRAIGGLDGLAATYLDTGFTSDGVRTPPPEELASIVEATHAAGGLFVADEVQAGHGRCGEHLWSFVRYGVTPDVVTLGKPMGNGYPVAAVIARADLFARLAEHTSVFSTFGGNPVAARAAIAVLDVIEDERLVGNARRVGSRLLASLQALRTRSPSIVDVRGAGLLIGVELADAGLARRVVDDVRDAGILIGRTGRAGERPQDPPAARLRGRARGHGRLRDRGGARVMLRGAIAAAVTPLRDAGEALDEDAFGPYTDFLAGAGLDGVLALGTTGEGFLLPVEQRMRAAQLFVESARGRLGRRRPLRGAVHLGDGRARGRRGRVGGGRGRGDGPAVLPAGRGGAVRALRRGRAGVRAAPVLRLRVRRAQRLRGAGRRDRAPALDGAEPGGDEGVRHAVGPVPAVSPRRAGRLRRAGGADPAGARGRRDRRGLRARVGVPGAGRGRRARPGLRRPGAGARRGAALPVPGGAEDRARPARGPDRAGRAPAPAQADRDRADRPGDMARIVIAGSGAIGASIAYHLALLGADGVVLAERDEVASGATGKAMGGVRQQFSTAAEVRLARDSVRFFHGLGPPLFEQVGYLFIATTEAGADRLRERMEVQRGLGVPVEDVDPARVDGLNAADVVAAGACWEDGVAEPAEITRELVRRAREGGVEVREGVDARDVEADVLVVAAGAGSPDLVPELPVRPLCRQLVDVGPVGALPQDLPMVIEDETTFHFRRRGETLRLAMTEPAPRWTDRQDVDEALVEDWRSRLAHRYPRAAGAPIVRAWAGLYDMTPDAHPIIGWVRDGVYAACGFSGHGFMQSPAVGRAVAEELVHGGSELDLSPYRLDRFGDEAVFPETVIL